MSVVLAGLLMPPLHSWLVHYLSRGAAGGSGMLVSLPVYQEFLARLPQPLAVTELLLPWMMFVLIRRLAGRRQPAPFTVQPAQHDTMQDVCDLIEQGVDLNRRDSSGHTLLEYAVRRGDRAVVTLLLDNGADLDVRDRDTGLSALHVAAEQGDADLCELLIRYGAEPDALASDGDTPLHIAAARGHAATVAVLLKYRAHPELCNAGGQTAVQLARQHPRVLEVLQENASQEWPYLKISGN